MIQLHIRQVGGLSPHRKIITQLFGDLVVTKKVMKEWETMIVVLLRLNLYVLSLNLGV